jgi:dipeptidyl aminopeptidase/acylaminoacyl peptidase
MIYSSRLCLPGGILLRLAAVALFAACSSSARVRDDEPRPRAERVASRGAVPNADGGASADTAPSTDTVSSVVPEGRPDSAAIAAYFAQQSDQKRRTDDIFMALLGPGMIVRKIAYAGADDLTIPAYLFAPLDTTARRPTILFVHGGVHADFGLAHLAQVHALVEQGYVIVAPDYRGSTGYGARFYAMIDYGGKEVDDVVAARDYLRRHVPYADLGRLAIMGYSHGGFIALHAVYRHPKHFKAAVAHVPVADLPARMRTHPPEYEALFAAQPAFGAPLTENPRPYVERSPSAHARKLRTPVLVHTADNDDDVFIVENHILRDSMIAAGKDTAGLYIYREWHDPPGGHSFGLLDTPQGQESWSETVAFLAKHLRPTPRPGRTREAQPAARDGSPP